MDEEEFTVRIVHHSVNQYILDGFDDMTPAKFALKDAKRTDKHCCYISQLWRLRD